MKHTLAWMLVTVGLMLTPSRGVSADATPHYSATAAHDAIETACAEATRDGKLVFLKSGFPECIWCVRFDHFHHTPEVADILGKYYVIVAVDTENMPDATAEFTRYAKVGAPAWVILTPDKQVIIDSYRDGQNVGYPFEPEEMAYYRSALKKATPSITDPELDTLVTQLHSSVKKH